MSIIYKIGRERRRRQMVDDGQEPGVLLFLLGTYVNK